MVQGSIIIAGQKYETPNIMVVSKTTDDGLSWQTTELTSNDGCAQALVVHPNNKNILFTGGWENTSTGQEYALFQTTNAGSNWTRANLTGSGNLRAIAFDSKNTNRAYIGSSNGVWTSSDGGTTWQNPTKAFWVNSVVTDPGTANKVYAGTSVGVFISTNNGQSWAETNSGLTNKMILCMDIDPVANVLYAGSQGNGIFRLYLTTGVDAERSSRGQPTQFVLYQNYPNPFNTSTEIQYNLMKTGRIRLSVLDIKGSLIQLLVDGMQSNGVKKVSWNGKDQSGKEVPSGIYLIRLMTDDRSETKKMIYQK